MKTGLSILTITKAEPFAERFLASMNRLSVSLNAQHVVAADGQEAAKTLLNMTWLRLPLIIVVNSKGYLESVHDDALIYCDGEYVLRLDDDERCSPAMIDWLLREEYRKADHWKFPRAHLWKDTSTVMLTPQLWPDHQTRCSKYALAGGRTWIHCGSPFGGGEEAPCVIEHHKFLVKSFEERQAIANRYDQISRGAGSSGMLAFQLPEAAYADQDVWLTRLGQGFASDINDVLFHRKAQL